MRMFGLAYGLLAYLAFLAAFGWIVLFLNDLWLPRSMNVGSSAAGWRAWAVDIGLVALFGLQHSIMARRAFKQRWTAVVPRLLERSTYVWATVACIAAIVLLWQPLPEVVWYVQSGPGRAIIYGLQGLGVVLIVASTFSIDHFELFGLRQTWAYYRGTEPQLPAFQTPLLYRVVRHPMQLGVAVVFWSTPQLSVGHCVFAGAMTGYIIVGLWFEERDLSRVFGDDYRDYKRRVPMLIPLSRFRRS